MQLQQINGRNTAIYFSISATIRSIEKRPLSEKFVDVDVLSFILLNLNSDYIIFPNSYSLWVLAMVSKS